MTKTTSTTDQLRALMTRHTATVSAPVAPIPRTQVQPAPASAPPATTTKPAVVPAAAAAPVTVSQPSKRHAAGRCTVWLSPVELAKVNTLMLQMHQRTGKPVTATEILRIGLSRVGKKSPDHHG